MDNRLRKSDKITMDDIANDLNVSKTTISRAISGKGRVGGKTKEKILDYIKAKGYKPNNTARALASSKTNNISVVLPDSNDGGDASFFKDCLVGVTEAALSEDYDVVLTVLAKDTVALKRLVENQKVDGVVLTRYTRNEVIPYLKENNVPFILIGTDPDDEVLQIDSNQQESCKNLVVQLLQKKFTKLVYLGASKKLNIEKIRFNGYKQAFSEQRIPLNKDCVFWDAQSNLNQIVDSVLKEKIDCFVCSDDVICLKLIEVLKEKQISIPGDVQVVSFFDNEELENNEIPITAVHLDTRKMCFLAGKIIIEHINNQNPQKNNSFECTIAFRSSNL